VTLVRLISNSAATGLLLDIFSRYGPDSSNGMAASIMLSSTESVFYCISIYFGAVHIRKTRYTVPGAMLATLAGIAAAVILVRP
jgi:spore maturation protein B